MCGIDEAGKGPVVGSMFVAGVLMQEKKLAGLEKMGVKDSKLLTHTQRIALAKRIREIAEDYKVIEVPPAEIDVAVESKTTNLNKLEGEKMAAIINALEPDKAILDCPSTNIPAFTAFIASMLDDNKIEMVAEHKADVKYVVVSAASILAKVAREDAVSKIEKKIGQSIGTGYPSNPECQKFLKENWNRYPDIFRKSWMTWKVHQKANQQKKLDQF